MTGPGFEPTTVGFFFFFFSQNILMVKGKIYTEFQHSRTFRSGNVERPDPRFEPVYFSIAQKIGQFWSLVQLSCEIWSPWAKKEEAESEQFGTEYTCN